VAGEIIHFRKRFIGGFNRDDVVAYITKISNERNEALEEKEEYQAKIEKLNELISEHCMKKDETERELAQLKSELSRLRSQVDGYVKEKQVCPAPEPEPIEQNHKKEKPSVLKIKLEKKRRN